MIFFLYSLGYITDPDISELVRKGPQVEETA